MVNIFSAWSLSFYFLNCVFWYTEVFNFGDVIYPVFSLVLFVYWEIFASSPQLSGYSPVCSSTCIIWAFTSRCMNYLEKNCFMVWDRGSSFFPHGHHVIPALSIENTFLSVLNYFAVFDENQLTTFNGNLLLGFLLYSIDIYVYISLSQNNTAPIMGRPQPLLSYFCYCHGYSALFSVFPSKAARIMISIAICWYLASNLWTWHLSFIWVTFLSKIV